MAFALSEAGALGGNNLVIAVAVVGWAVLIVDLVAGRRNLRGLAVGWQLPEELFAGRSSRGAFQIRNEREHGVAREVHCGDALTATQFEAVDPGDSRTVPAWWRPSQRGSVDLEGLWLSSEFPFGLFRHTREEERDATCLVYPAPRFDPAWAGAHGAGDGESGQVPGGAGELLDLRPYRPGDRLRSLHWRTSARFGTWMVVERARDEHDGVRVRVDPERPIEAELSAAAGAIVEATTSGASVSLEIPGHPDLEAYGAGTRWRRTLLDTLATYEPS